MRAFRDRIKKLREGLKSVFTERTDEASAVQYFQVSIQILIMMGVFVYM